MNFPETNNLSPIGCQHRRATIACSM